MNCQKITFSLFLFFILCFSRVIADGSVDAGAFDVVTTVDHDNLIAVQENYASAGTGDVTLYNSNNIMDIAI